MNRNTTYDFGGERLSLKQISARTGVYYKTLLYRYKTNGGSMDAAALKPVLTRSACGRRALASSRSRWN